MLERKPSSFGLEIHETMFGSGRNPICNGITSGAPSPIRSVFKPRRATACASEIAIVVLPVPPDLLQTVTMRSPPAPELLRCVPPDQAVGEMEDPVLLNA